MPTRKKKKIVRKRGIGGKIALYVMLALVLLFGAVMGYAALNANTVYVRHAAVAVSDLPASFEGKTILFVSDIDICGINTPEKMTALFTRLQSLNPDILLLGGDYTTTPLIDVLNSTDKQNTDKADQIRARTKFFQGIANFQAPLGKFAIAGDNDMQIDNLAEILQANNIQPLYGKSTDITVSGDTLHLVGINAAAMDLNYNALGQSFQTSDCVIALMHSPSAIPKILTSEAANNGPWADLIFAGHTHGGQIRLFNRNVIRLSAQEAQYLAGWHQEGSLSILTNTGVGCEGANLRLGSNAEVWFITLKHKVASLPDLSA